MIMGGRVVCCHFVPILTNYWIFGISENERDWVVLQSAYGLGLVAQGPGGFGDSNRGAPM